MEESMNDEEIAADAAITDTFQKIMYRSSPKIFKLAFNKLKSYVEVRKGIHNFCHVIIELHT
jgi:hypothetical protein